MCVVINIWQRKAKSRVGNYVLGITAIYVKTGKACPGAQVLALAPAKLAMAACICEPGNADTLSGRQPIYVATSLRDNADYLVSRNNGRLAAGKLAVNHMEVGAANAAGVDLDKNLVRIRFRYGDLDLVQATTRRTQLHGTHLLSLCFQLPSLQLPLIIDAGNDRRHATSIRS